MSKRRAPSPVLTPFISSLRLCNYTLPSQFALQLLAFVWLILHAKWVCSFTSLPLVFPLSWPEFTTVTRCATSFNKRLNCCSHKQAHSRLHLYNPSM